MTSAVDVQDQLAALDAAIAIMDGVRADAQQDRRRFGFDDPWSLFIRKMRMLTPQSYGTRIQNRLAEHFGWATVPSSLDKGDVRDADGEHHEIKVTLITGSNPGANFVQIRPHQEIAGYHLFVVEPDYSLVHLWLSKEQMADELSRVGTSAHGTKTANTANVNKEWAIRFTWDRDSPVAKRWLENYGQPTPQLP